MINSPTNENNVYYPFLMMFYNRLISLKYNGFIMNKTMQATLQKYNYGPQDRTISVNALIISDITGDTDNGWRLNFHTGVSKNVLAKNFDNEVTRLISVECCHLLAQGFEA